MRLEDRALLVGETGCGKSTLAAYIVEGLQPVRTIVVDPKDELELGVPKARSASELDFSGPVIHYVPASFEREDLEEASQRIWQCPGPWVCLIDELAEISSPNYCPEGFRLGVTQGRSKRKAFVVCTQRLAESHPCFRSQATHRFLMCPAPIELDLKMIAGHLGIEAGILKRQLDELESQHGPHAHLWHVGPGKELRRCAPLSAGGSSGQPAGRPLPAGEDSGQPATALDDESAGSLTCEESDSASGLS
jgi:energy-coupling factor transporter ATP-binding protein EcfA2